MRLQQPSKLVAGLRFDLVTRLSSWRPTACAFSRRRLPSLRLRIGDVASPRVREELLGVARNMRRSLCGRTEDAYRRLQVAPSLRSRGPARFAVATGTNSILGKVDGIVQVAGRDRRSRDSCPVRTRFQFNRFNAFNGVDRDTISLLRSVSKRTAGKTAQGNGILAATSVSYIVSDRRRQTICLPRSLRRITRP